MPNDLRTVFGRLRDTLWNRAEQAYSERDAKGATEYARHFAAGEAHAYGVAEMDVQDAQKERDNKA